MGLTDSANNYQGTLMKEKHCKGTSARVKKMFTKTSKTRFNLSLILQRGDDLALIHV